MVRKLVLFILFGFISSDLIYDGHICSSGVLPNDDDTVKVECSDIKTLRFHELYKIIVEAHFEVSHFYIKLNNLNSIDLLLEAGKVYEENVSFYLEISDSALQFTYGDLIITKENVERISNNRFVFDQSHLTGISFQNIEFLNSIPDTVIKNAWEIDKLTFINSNISNAFYETSSNLKGFKANSEFQKLVIKNPDIPFKSSDINMAIFSKITSFDLRDTEIWIDEAFRCKHRNIKEFIYSPLHNRNQYWLRNLNMKYFDFENNNASLDGYSEDFFKPSLHGYDASFLLDENICLFDGFAHNSLIIPYLDVDDGAYGASCSCTFYWLYRYYNRYPSKIKDEIRYDALVDSKLNALEDCFDNRFKMRRCNFTKLFENCPKLGYFTLNNSPFKCSAWSINSFNYLYLTLKAFIFIIISNKLTQ